MLTAKNGPRTRTWPILLGAAAVVGLVIGLALFKPWLLFVDVRVDDQLPAVATSAGRPQPSPAASSQVPAAPGATLEPGATPERVPVGPVQLALGSLVSHEHATSGTVRTIQQPDGARVVTLENLQTSNGPDVHVWLSAADVVEGAGGWFTAGAAGHHDLGVIKGNQGNQVYGIRTDLDLSKYRSIDLWCVQFSVSFGAAQLAF